MSARLFNRLAGFTIGFTVLISGCAGVGNSPKALRTAVDAKQGWLDNCYAKALAHDGATAGKMTVWMHVPEDKKQVDAVEIESTQLTNKRLQKCVKTALVGLQIASAPGQDLKIEYTLKFEPEEN